MNDVCKERGMIIHKMDIIESRAHWVGSRFQSSRPVVFTGGGGGGGQGGFSWQPVPLQQPAVMTTDRPSGLRVANHVTS